MGILGRTVTFVFAAVVAVIGRPQDSRCPAVDEGSMGICVEECSGNADCTNDNVCCSNGCGHVCMAPRGSGVDTGNSASCLLVVRVEKEESSIILEQIPKPSNLNKMFGGKILSIGYSGEQSVVCCTIESTLKEIKGVKSVEWDGRRPPCANRPQSTEF
eukprot:TRINITY_DN26662_c0_g1_i2.p1 TRINITY_DN26662_c0_g1~~TRINITY_DN26662_c0_g1_i2.p1  ORF type:complete len:159 (-),score=28.04 TRINITY_DN26662_c0_g1_i2:70-546(-)